MNTETRVESQAVSASCRPERWHAINWRKTSEAVRKLQVRIAKAALQQEWRRVKALQRMLTRSLAAKALAVRRVTENRGKDTPGVDGKLWSTPKTKWEAIFDMKRTGYHPKPL
ncbi:reverse transcriptase N-terminal domain-containing protein, partial [Salmonella enterica subsp. enterica serovar London]|nr:reverse transcriptase N-terminal domain-containing protein [Salmonella enterica subsp. enterica serovar London]